MATTTTNRGFDQDEIKAILVALMHLSGCLPELVERLRVRDEQNQALLDAISNMASDEGEQLQ